MSATKKKKARRSAKSPTRGKAKRPTKPRNGSADTSSKAAEYFQYLDNLQREANARFEVFVEANRQLPCTERAEEWLKFVLSLDDPVDFGDQEAAIHLTSRGKDCTAYIQKINDRWLHYEQRTIERC